MEAGLKSNDVVLSIDDEKLISVSELQEKIAEYRSGDIVKVQYVRESEKYTIDINLQ